MKIEILHDDKIISSIAQEVANKKFAGMGGLTGTIYEEFGIEISKEYANSLFKVNFKDFAVSGKTTDRPDFQTMMEKVKKKNIHLIIFTKLDRLARSLQDLLNIHSELEKHGVKIVAVEQQIDTSTYQGRLNFQIMGAFAEFERNITRERMELGRKKAELVGTKSGKPCHRPKVNVDEDGVKFKHKAGWSMHQIAKHYQVSITPIRRILKV